MTETTNDDDDFCIADGPMDFEWFRKVLDKSRTLLDAAPENSQPSWYRTYTETIKPAK